MDVSYLDFTPIIVSSWYSVCSSLVCSTLISFSLSHCFKVGVEKKAAYVTLQPAPWGKTAFLTGTHCTKIANV